VCGVWRKVVEVKLERRAEVSRTRRRSKGDRFVSLNTGEGKDLIGRRDKFDNRCERNFVGGGPRGFWERGGMSILPEQDYFFTRGT